MKPAPPSTIFSKLPIAQLAEEMYWDEDVLRSKLVELKKQLITVEKAKGKNALKAKEWVEQRYISIELSAANGTMELCASKEAVELAGMAVFPRKEGELSANQIARNYTIDKAAARDLLENQRRQWIKNYLKDHRWPGANLHAQLEVNRSWVGWRRDRHQLPVLCATPGCIKALGLQKRALAEPPAEDELSVPTVADKYGLSINTTINKIEAVRARLIDDVAKATGMSHVRSAIVVDHQLVGLRKSKHGRPGFHLTPEGERQWCEMVLKEKDQRFKDDEPTR